MTFLRVAPTQPKRPAFPLPVCPNERPKQLNYTLICIITDIHNSSGRERREECDGRHTWLARWGQFFDGNGAAMRGKILGHLLSLCCVDFLAGNSNLICPLCLLIYLLQYVTKLRFARDWRRLLQLRDLHDQFLRSWRDLYLHQPQPRWQMHSSRRIFPKM